jgi:integrase
MRDGKEYWYGQWREPGGSKSKEFGLCRRVPKSVARAALDEILRPLNEKIKRRADTNQTLERFIQETYLPTKKDGYWKGSTSMTTEGLIKTHLIADLGALKMSELSRNDLQAFLKLKAQRGLSRSVVSHLRWQLRAILRLAVSDGVVSIDCAAGLHTPRCSEPNIKRILTGKQVRQGLSLLELREQLVVRLTVHEGMRPGEVFGLQPGDVENGVVHVRRRVYRGEIDDPKVTRSRREVALSLGTTKLMAEWLLLREGVSPDAWLFPSESGVTPLGRDNVWRRKIQPAFEKLGLDWANFQVMRRTFATLSKKAGVDAKIRADHMGNTVDVNENEYTLTSLEQRREAVLKLERLIDEEDDPEPSSN